MVQYKTRGLILKRKKIGEADRLLTIFTEKQGKIKAVAKGSRKILSKLGGHLELFYLSDFILIEGKNLDTIISAQIIEDFPKLRESEKKIESAYLLVDLVDKMVGEKDPAKKLLDLLLECFNYLNKEKKENPLPPHLRFWCGGLLLSYFELRLLSLLGHRPEIDVCVKCRGRLDPKINFFSYQLGGILCGNCNNYDSIKISSEAIKVMRLFLGNDILILNKLNTNFELQEEIGQILFRFTRGIIEKEIKSIYFSK